MIRKCLVLYFNFVVMISIHLVLFAFLISTMSCKYGIAVALLIMAAYYCIIFQATHICHGKNAKRLKIEMLFLLVGR